MVVLRETKDLKTKYWVPITHGCSQLPMGVHPWVLDIQKSRKYWKFGRNEKIFWFCVIYVYGVLSTKYSPFTPGEKKQIFKHALLHSFLLNMKYYMG